MGALRVIEFEALGPGPLAACMLSALGARVTAVARPNASPVDRALMGEDTENPLRQGKKIIALDLKNPNGVKTALDLIADADALIEGNRPGVMERLGLGPAECAVRNPMGTERATSAGRWPRPELYRSDWIAITGSAIGYGPIVPPTVLGDAAGALGLCFGVVSAVTQSGHLDLRRRLAFPATLSSRGSVPSGKGGGL